MSELPQPEEETPVPDAAPAPVFPHPIPPAQEAPVISASPPDPAARAAQLQAELAAIRAAAAAGETTLVRVLPPHDSFTFGAATVYASPTPVPAHAVAPLLTAAAEAGVTIEEA